MTAKLKGSKTANSDECWYIVKTDCSLYCPTNVEVFGGSQGAKLVQNLSKVCPKFVQHCPKSTTNPEKFSFGLR